MSEHPRKSHDPQCPRADDDDPRARPCWCALSAAVRAEERLASIYAKDFYQQGYAAALDAARGAVAAVEMGGEHFWSVGFRDGITIALAALDALRGESNE